MTNLQTTTTAQIGQIANEHAAQAAFADYKDRKAKNTITRQKYELARFAEYLAAVQITTTADALQTSPDAWRGMTWGLIAGFVQWQLRQGFAGGTVGVRLSTVKTYAALAFKAGCIDATEHQLIQSVKGYGRAAQKRIDEGRTTTRRSTKKADALQIPPEQVKALKANHLDTPQGRRDRVMMMLLLNLGLRVSEIVLLRARDFDLDVGTVTFFRPKVDKTQTHNLINGLADAARTYVVQDITDTDAPLLRASLKTGKLSHAGMTRIGIAKRVQQLGAAIGIANLSPHDLRHSWATRAARNGTDAFALRDGGGWSSIAMPARYIEAAQIANQGIKLDE